jgi:hypothetical protein
LALVLRESRFAAREADDEAVDADSVNGAMALIQDFQAQATRVYSRFRVTRAEQRAETALRWIQAHSNVCIVRDLQRHRVAGVTRASQAEKLVRDLVEMTASRSTAR